MDFTALTVMITIYTQNTYNHNYNANCEKKKNGDLI